MSIKITFCSRISQPLVLIGESLKYPALSQEKAYRGTYSDGGLCIPNDMIAYSHLTGLRFRKWDVCQLHLLRLAPLADLPGFHLVIPLT